MVKLNNNEKGFGIIEGLLIVAVVVLLGYVGYMVYKNHNKTTNNSSTITSTTTPATKSTTPTTTPVQATAQYGTITGSASYPSSGLPTDEQVCAVDITSSAKVYCDKIGARQPANNCGSDLSCTPPSPVLKFSVKVPTGDYYVYATAEKELPNYKAYYDEYSKCGNSVNCPATGHKQYIKVTVAANATVENADPGDWYAN